MVVLVEDVRHQRPEAPAQVQHPGKFLRQVRDHEDDMVGQRPLDGCGIGVRQGAGGIDATNHGAEIVFQGGDGNRHGFLR